MAILDLAAVNGYCAPVRAATTHVTDEDAVVMAKELRKM